MRIFRTSFRILKGGSCLASLLLLGTGLVLADSVTYTFTGSGTGTLGSTSFTDESFVVTLTSDTADVGIVAGLGSIPAIVGLPADIDITGIAPLNFTGTAFIFASGTIVGFGEDDGPFPSPPGNLIEINDPSISGSALTSDLTASGTNGSLSQFIHVDTNDGPLTFSSMSSVTFQSEVSGVPEPRAIFLLGTILLCVVATVWRRKAI